MVPKHTPASLHCQCIQFNQHNADLISSHPKDSTIQAAFKEGLQAPGILFCCSVVIKGISFLPETLIQVSGPVAINKVFGLGPQHGTSFR